MTDQAHFRPIRSFVKREGRLSNRQSKGLSDGWPRYGVDYTGEPLDLAAVFGNTNPVILEIGFGMGQSLREQALANPEQNYLGIEVHGPGVGSLLADCLEENIQNLRIMQHDATEVIANSLGDGCLTGVQIYFPDPWHKKKHHKRRLVQTAFIESLLTKLKAGGFIHMATDWEDYAEQMLEVLSNVPELDNQGEANGYWPNDGRRPLTKFEKRGQRLGHGVWDLLFHTK